MLLATYDLELDGHEAEVDDLYSRPEHVVCLQSWNVNVLHFLDYGPSAPSFGNGHESKETPKTYKRQCHNASSKYL